VRTRRVGPGRDPSVILLRHYLVQSVGWMPFEASGVPPSRLCTEVSVRLLPNPKLWYKCGDRYKNEIIAGRSRRLLRHVGTESDVLQAGLDVLSEGGVVVKVGVFVPRQEVASPRYVPGEVFGETGAVTRLETEPSRRHQSPESVCFRRPRPSHRYSRVCRGADIYPEGLAPRLELVGDGDVVAEHAVPGHLHAHHPR
jgi:hypothetical protein